MGQPLLALALAGPLLFAQDPDPERESVAVWNELFQMWGDEFREVKALREDPDLREEADELYRELVGDLADAARRLSVPLYWEAQRLGTDAELTPDLEKRLEWLELCLTASRLQGDEPAATRAAQEMAKQLVEAGRSVRAAEVLASSLSRTCEPASRAYILRDLAETERLNEAHGRALERLIELEAIVANEPPLAYLSEEVRNIRSYVYIDLGLPDRAATATLERWETAEAKGAGEELVAARIAYAHWLLAVGDLARLVELVTEFLAEDSAVGTVRAELLLLLGVAEVGLEVEKPESPPRGEERLAQAIALGLGVEGEAFARLALVELHLRRGHLDKAAEELRFARAGLEGPEGGAGGDWPSTSIELVTLEARLALARGSSASELTRARERLSEGLDSMLAKWAQAPDREGGVGWLLYPKRRTVLGEYARLCMALEGEERGAELALERILVADTLGTLARRSALAPPSLERIRAELLGPDRGVLLYLPTRGESHVFALDREGLVHAGIAPSYEIEALRRRYLAHLIAGRSAVSDPEQREWALARERSLATELATMLLPDRIRARVSTWEGVTLVGTDSLGVLPFEWLPLGERPYLGVELAVDSLPSLPLGVAWSRRGSSPSVAHDLILVGGTRHSESVGSRWPELEPLPLSDAEAAELTGAYGSDRVRVLRADTATPGALARLDLASARVLQFLVHGVLERERERPLALVLGPDGEESGLFRCEDAEARPAPALVVLSACRTGIGPARKGDPSISDMGGAWLSAGARAVLLARADLSWNEAIGTTTPFHLELAAGAPPAEALRVARAGRAQELGAETPFHSGLMTLVGLGHVPVFDPPGPGATSPPASRPPLLTLAVVALALCVGLLLGYRYGRG